MNETLIKADGVSKKFCLSLKKSLRYGMMDLGSEILGKRHRGNGELRDAEFWAVDDVSFEVKRGECLGLIGANGAGKSTLLRMLNGLIKPDAGQIEINGRVGALIELGAGFNPILAGRENIYVNGSVLGFSKKEIDRKLDAIIDFAEIGEFIDSPVQNYSSGMKVRLGFAVAAQMEPDVLIVDEVLAVGDIGFRVKCLNRISELMANSAVVFVSHTMPQVSRICTHALLMRKGESVTTSQTVSNVIDAYYKEFDTGKKTNTISNNFRLQNVLLNGGKEGESPVVPFDGDLQISMDCDVLADCRKLQLQIVVWNQDQRPVLDIITEDLRPFRWDNNAENITLRAEISSLRLAGGKYSIVLWVSDPESMEILCRVENAATFTMGYHLASASESFHSARWSCKSRILVE